MQPDRTADPARLAGTVRGLGVCDVLRVELAACQHGALSSELARRAAASARELEEVEARARARVGARRRAAEEAALARLHDERRALARLRAALPAAGVAPFVLLAPAGLAIELVAACLRSSLARLTAGLGEGPSHPAAATSALEAAGAWITTALDCHAVEAFCLEPGVDPPRSR